MPTLMLETSWAPAADDRALAYTLKLTNTTKTPLSNFHLCVSGPGRIDPGAGFDQVLHDVHHGPRTTTPTRWGGWGTIRRAEPPGRATAA